MFRSASEQTKPGGVFMRDTQTQLKILEQKIKKARKARDEMDEAAVPETLELESVDIIPLGQAPKQHSDTHQY